ncbi:hypothetical protein HCZ23_00620 [Celeribacter sp. HF31]|uniref:hypothetical protein n=1 Tax=Celeribacter sp. HF31 TaxID=2721558 RepID=UPI001431CB28|nr:hypothetical protein [Celeribacter sp. HF31]NIY77974.1 hypothetical protein [Celeribacter sp. HF31]
MLSWFRFLRNFPFGIFLGFIAAMGLFWFLEADLNDDLTRYGTYILTALASLLASAAAFATAVWNTERQREARLRAARAALPMALTHLISVARSGIDYSLKSNIFLDDSDNLEEVSNAIEIPPSILEILRSCIENSDEETGLWLSLTISRYQVYRSRLLGLIEDTNMPSSDFYRSSYAANWSLYHAIVEHLFRYAREGIRPEASFETQRLHSPMFDRAGHPLEADIHRILEERYADSYSRTAEGLTFKGN